MSADPHHTLCQTLEAILDDCPPPLAAMCRSRNAEGHRLYGDDWVERDNVPEAREEIADAIVYSAMLQAQGYPERLVRLLVSFAASQWKVCDKLEQEKPYCPGEQ